MSMNYPPDYLVDRRALRRKVSFWRVLAFLAAFLALGFAAWRISGGGTGEAFQTSHVARITLSGLITGDRATLKMLEDVRKSKSVAAVVVNLESPGGTTTGSELVYDEIRRIAATKPVVGVVGNMAASGAYIAALSTDRIFVHGNSLVGSIGVLFQFPNASKLMETIGVKLEEVKSSPLKAAPNGLDAPSPEARAAINALVVDSYDWFKKLVKERRNLSDSELATVSDGRVFTGRQSLPLKLADALGGEREAIQWLEREKGVTKDLPVRDWRRQSTTRGISLFGAAGSLAGLAGFDHIAGLLHKAELAQEALVLDGLLAIWQGPGVN